MSDWKVQKDCSECGPTGVLAISRFLVGKAVYGDSETQNGPCPKYLYHVETGVCKPCVYTNGSIETNTKVIEPASILSAAFQRALEAANAASAAGKESDVPEETWGESTSYNYDSDNYNSNANYNNDNDDSYNNDNYDSDNNIYPGDTDSAKWSQLAREADYVADEGPITRIFLSSLSSCPHRGKQVPVVASAPSLSGNLNQGASDKEIFMCYTRGTGAEGESVRPITAIYLSSGPHCDTSEQDSTDMARIPKPNSLNGDLNQDATGSQDVYVCTGTATSGPPITELFLDVFSPDLGCKDSLDVPRSTALNGDLNQGSQGIGIMLCFRKGQCKDMCRFCQKPPKTSLGVLTCIL